MKRTKDGARGRVRLRPSVQQVVRDMGRVRRICEIEHSALEILHLREQAIPF